MERIFFLVITACAVYGCKSQQTQTASSAIFTDEQKKIRYHRMPELVAADFKAAGDSINFQIKEATLHESKLKVDVKYGGGCRMHEFKLVFPEQTDGDTIQLYLLHLSNGDNCRAFVHNALEFDVSKISEEIQHTPVRLNNVAVIRK
jgi:hypothetical protein